jgi:RNA polymerase sigma-70 factor (ECF subfamily)
MESLSQPPFEPEILGLINAYCKGNNDSFADLMHEWYKELFFYTFRFVEDEDIAEDIISETIEKMLGLEIEYRQDKFNKQEINLKFYLKLVIKNKCLDYLKIQKNRSKLLERFKKTLLGFAVNEEKIKNDQKHLVHLLSHLNEKEKKIMLMDIEGYSIKEISQELGLAKKTVSNSLYESRKKLKLTILK